VLTNVSSDSQFSQKHNNNLAAGMSEEKTMKRDIFGICLSKSMLSNNLSSTFTHVRAYQKSDQSEDVTVMHAFPQMSGQELLTNMKQTKRLLWRAEFVCSDNK
jgi:hypothetical protein